MIPGAKAIVIYQNKILLILRDNIPSIPYPNKWDFPGCGVENNESPTEMIRRELQEELSILTQNITYLVQKVLMENMHLDY